MQIYDFKDVEKCYVCGNIDRNINKFIQMLTSNLANYQKEEHPKEAERQERLRNRGNGSMRVSANLGGMTLRPFGFEPTKRKAIDSTYNDSVIIVSGNCGIGSKSDKYYNEVFGKLNEALKANNCFLLFVRGNNDDPSYFENEKINMENVKTIPDYSVVILKTFNCLCIGGSISLDKEWKLSQKEQFGKTLYWEDEKPILNEELLDEILKKYQIGCVITSTSPSFAFPGTNAFNQSKWIKNNPKIKSNLSSERKTMDKIYEKIVDNDTKPYVWLYGRFKQNNYNKVNDIVFESLLPFQMEDVRNLITRYFNIDLSKKLGGNVFTFDTFIADNERQIDERRMMIDDPFENENAEATEEIAEEDEIIPDMYAQNTYDI